MGWLLATITHPTSEARQFHHLDSCDEQAEGSERHRRNEARIVPRPERQRRAARRSRALIYNRDTTQHERCELRKSCPWSRNDEAPMKGPRRGGMIRPCRVGVGPPIRLASGTAERRAAIISPVRWDAIMSSSAFPFPVSDAAPPARVATVERLDFGAAVGWFGTANGMAHQYRS